MAYCLASNLPHASPGRSLRQLRRRTEPHLRNRPSDNFGNWEEADELAIAALSARPDIELLLLVRCVAAAQAGAPARSVKFAREAAAASNQDGFSLAFLAWAHANAGDTEETHAILARLRNRPAPKALMASVRLAQGDRRGATNLLQTANREHCPWASLAWCDPRLSPLSSQQAR